MSTQTSPILTRKKLPEPEIMTEFFVSDTNRTCQLLSQVKEISLLYIYVYVVVTSCCRSQKTLELMSYCHRYLKEFFMIYSSCRRLLLYESQISVYSNVFHL
jgi:hypothetical protein